MGQMLTAMLNLQSIERQLAQVRRRLKSRQNAVTVQQRKIDQRRDEWGILHESMMNHRVRADSLGVDLKSKEDRVAHLRTSLNTAKTNKEYAAILTQMNTIKADNARLEESVLQILQQVDVIAGEAKKIEADIEVEQQRLTEIQAISQAEIDRLNAMIEQMTAKRDIAAEAVSPQTLAAFNRTASRYDGEAMAEIEVQGRKPPYSYVCGGCYMTLNAEHANALRVRDEIRTCDNCGRILYISTDAAQ